MPILLDEGSNVRSFELEFSYDPDVLVYQSVSWGESVSGLTILDSQEDGIIKVSAAGTEAVDPGSIALGWVEFEMVDTFDDYQTTVTLARSRLNEEYELIDGSVAVYTNALLVVDEWGHGGVPEVFSLEQNFPNPFNPVTQIRYQLPEQSRVTISIYDIMGRAVRTLVSSETQIAGYRQVLWDATNDLGQPVSAGMYLYVIQAQDFRDTRKMVLMK
ncbi:MAG TPA: T9SS type A sorting domain-containing protein [Candidatus Marinimicrobia bacterium]|nr:T9SS type A sorting domain-containing protein [Candidatus Neomarinimicrobiota bacterium]